MVKELQAFHALKRVVVLVLCACRAPVVATPSRASPPTWMVRACNQTGTEIHDVLLGTTTVAPLLRDGACTGWFDRDVDRVYPREATVFATRDGTFSVDPGGDTSAVPLPRGFYTYRLRIVDPANHVGSASAVEEHPPVLVRVCNETSDLVEGLQWYDDVLFERPLAPGRCSAWRPAASPPGYRGASYDVGNVSDGTGTRYTLRGPDPHAPALGAGRWTLQLEIIDRATHTSALGLE